MVDIVDGVTSSHRRLVASVTALSEGDVRRPSLLPGWTRAVLISHLSSAGRAALRCALAAVEGKSVAMYPGGERQRDNEIESGRDRALDELVAELTAVCDECDVAFDAIGRGDWDVPMLSRRGPIPMRSVVIQRWLDVETHHVDLDVGYTSRDWPDALVDEALPTAVQMLPALRQRPDAVRSVVGTWRLVRTDGTGDWTVHADPEQGSLGDQGTADCEIVTPGRSLLALLLGRQVQDDLAVNGDTTLANNLKAAFPGP